MRSVAPPQENKKGPENRAFLISYVRSTNINA